MPGRRTVAGGLKAAASPGSGMNFEVIRGHLAAFPIGYELEVHLLAFPEVAQSGTLHGTDVNESVRPTLVGCDKAKAFLGVEPFNGPGRHEKPFQKTKVCAPAKQPDVELAISETNTWRRRAKALPRETDEPDRLLDANCLRRLAWKYKESL
jgi:hypothetical protein